MNFNLIYRQMALVIYGNQFLNDHLQDDLNKMPHFQILHPILRDFHCGQLLAGSLQLILYHLKHKGAYKLSLIHAPRLASTIQESPIFYLSDHFYNYMILIQYRHDHPQILIGCEEKELWYLHHQNNNTDLYFNNVNALTDRIATYTLFDLNESFIENLGELKAIDWKHFSQSYFDCVYINEVAFTLGSANQIEHLANIQFKDHQNYNTHFDLFPKDFTSNYAASLLTHAENLYKNYLLESETRNDQAWCNQATRHELQLFDQAVQALNNFYPSLIVNAANHYSNANIQA
ncbi:hypothetical protein [Acinetobacter bereziniae]|uniref:hypothetical protein n=1 Tax=Acinetobacter bereziniae TaxID=106648 RepID=UPI0012500509|nr:hypothetical protein [Acinetobacter bereziniae]MBJ9904084.1 hypothetical protein [Acinetobacter bereziniae]MCU4320115.1 hypothetical protein [Acinetobacter bereziniae]MCU4600404.1 hypothetical protein [Acinetobacter bereziniae]